MARVQVTVKQPFGQYSPGQSAIVDENRVEFLVKRDLVTVIGPAPDDSLPENQDAETQNASASPAPSVAAPDPRIEAAVLEIGKQLDVQRRDGEELADYSERLAAYLQSDPDENSSSDSTQNDEAAANQPQGFEAYLIDRFAPETVQNVLAIYSTPESIIKAGTEQLTEISLVGNATALKLKKVSEEFLAQ